MRRWVEAGCDDASVARLVKELSLEPVAARVLASRGLAEPADAERFLASRLADLPDPFTMAGMEAAVARLARALEAGERIALYGDYDVDGVTSTALLAGFLRACGGDVVTYVPHRLTEGYGLNTEAVRRLVAEHGARLLVSLDCGITSVEEVRQAAALGVDAIVVDHHTVPVELPAAVAILNPHRPGCGYPYKPLAAVGVTFCLAMALRKRLREAGRFGAARQEPNLRAALDLVALGTVADVVPLTGVNRTLVRWGLEELARTARPGLRALKRVAGIPDGPVSAGQIGFRIGPRINAAGRLDDAGRGVRLLLTADPAEADRLADELDAENRSRQEIERRILGEALSEAEARVRDGARGLVLGREGWHPGVIGIVASRVVERFHRPTVLVGLEGGVGKGSGRSIEGFHLYDALAGCAAHLTRFGGHRHAAGVTLDAGALPAFAAAFEGWAAARLTDDDLVPRCRIEGWVAEEELTERVARALERLAPFGAGHPEPLFALRGRPLRARTVGQGGAHLKLAFGRGIDAIGFSLGERLGLCGGEVEAAVSLGFESWNGAERLQLRIKDLRAAG